MIERDVTSSVSRLLDLAHVCGRWRTAVTIRWRGYSPMPERASSRSLCSAMTVRHLLNCALIRGSGHIVRTVHCVPCAGPTFQQLPIRGSRYPLRWQQLPLIPTVRFQA
jgi:hypothetical protein